MKYSGIGGQAVIEGVMMKNGDEYATAVRKPDGEIEVKKDTYISMGTRLRMNVHFWASLAWEKPRSSVEEGQILFQPLPLFRAKKPKSFLP